jgi:hypothetical protein
MPEILQAVFEYRGLHVPPWGYWMPRKRVSEEDIDFWVARRGWKRARSKDGRRIFGEEFEEGATYDVREATIR